MSSARFAQTACPIARSLARVGDTWSMLILRDAHRGSTRFDDFQRSLGVAPNILAARLRALIASGLLERRPYTSRPLRHDYILTNAGKDFRPVLLMLLAWGNRHFAPDGVTVQLTDTETGLPADPVLTDARTGRPIAFPAFAITAGPAAGAAIYPRRNSPQVRSHSETAT